jgi:hypothetical protein
VADDPRERANLKEVHPEVYTRLKQDFAAWNETMLPETEGPARYFHTANRFADRPGVTHDLREDVD